MPQSSDYLRKKFLTRTDDGIGKCERMIRVAGGSCKDGIIEYNGHDEETWEAIEYLINEWDYAFFKIR